ncbi:MAG: aldo/keto reductase [Rikenellaceae bacterium]|nr:aldo/keto reductase [Rikenellaceae bacterium]
MNGKLGFGTMRLPLTDPSDPASIDLEKLSQMVDIFLDRGFTYFDTAYTYHEGHCEAALRQALVERYPRERYSLTDKLPTLLLENERQQESIFAEQLRRCGVEWFDRYLVHCATEAFWTKAERMHSFEFALRKKREGLTRQVGFSYHDSPELLERILDRYPEVDFVQLQISYMDWEHTPIRARECYELVRSRRKPVVVMCPLKGGMLSDVPDRVARMMRASRPGSTPTEWAIRYAASLEGVETVLSGMSSPEQMERNTAFMSRLVPLDAGEREVVRQAAEIISRAEPIQCTGCGYCVPVCSQRIPIPDYLHLYNADTRAGHTGFESRYVEYRSWTGDHTPASECIDCGSCEGACPQHLEIAGWMKRVAGLFESGTQARRA